MLHTQTTIECEPSQPGYVAAYLRVAGNECAFVETYTAHAVPHLLATLRGEGRRPEDVRWIVVTHAHLDHAGGASALLTQCPNATLVAHPRAARHLIDPSRLQASAIAVYGEEHFRKVYGSLEPIPQNRVLTLEDGGTFELGDATFRVHHTEGHAKHHFVVHDTKLATVYTGDTFGLVYPRLQNHGTFAFASTSPTDFDPAAARQSLDKVMALGATTVRPTHFGEVKDLDEVARQVRMWIDRSEVWLEAMVRGELSRDELAVAIQDALQAQAQSLGFSFDADALALLQLDIQLNADGIAWVAGKKRMALTPKV